MVRQHHPLNGHGSLSNLGDSEGQGSLACCCPWSCKESNTSWCLNNNSNKLGARDRGTRRHLGPGQDWGGRGEWRRRVSVWWGWSLVRWGKCVRPKMRPWGGHHLELSATARSHSPNHLLRCHTWCVSVRCCREGRMAIPPWSGAVIPVRLSGPPGGTCGSHCVSHQGARGKTPSRRWEAHGWA